MADIVRERLSLALDEYAALERKHSESQETIGELRAELKTLQTNESAVKLALARLKKEHEEEILISHTVEFRRGKRTGGKWRPFCPRCHLPVTQYEEPTYLAYCTDVAHCGWISGISSGELGMVSLPD